ncbi:NAD-dependent epimerase/dehydratase family protein [Schinkia azotoformans]|uniref:NAD-dependent epimerase/dehydratase family protein n=2 Tax=Schinkia azotoformans TaxID=1454 RepID=UPI002E1FBDD8|nr:NAD-dependent epimerase/dehydratase family protein [Schinkia azotoformans]MED4366402.1 NAD-dependent epimerase/dehydratase family protein [Schinkia azotoformans]
MYYNNKIYKEDLKTVLMNQIPLEKMKGCNILITGASGLIGSFLVDTLMLINEVYGYDINVFAMSRNKAGLENRFETHIKNRHLNLIQHDVNFPLESDYEFEYIIHAASNAYPDAFSTDPVGTIMGNVWGVYNLLEYARAKGLKRFLFISSGEVYGEGKDEVDSFEESYSGYVDSTNPRSCYPNGKRTAETLCVSYAQQYGIDSIIARPCHIYGPTANSKDNRASSQFVNNVIQNKDIILKSKGLQLRSYCYVADCVSGILTILLKGQTCSAYNIANSNSIVTIREMADVIASISGRKVLSEIPNSTKELGYNPVSKSILNTKKLEGLGWKPIFDINRGLKRTVKILDDLQKKI